MYHPELLEREEFLTAGKEESLTGGKQDSVDILYAINVFASLRA